MARLAVKRINPTKTKAYRDYMKSQAWLDKREEVMKRDNYQCVVCLSNTKLVVHHRSYQHLGNEPLEDLVCLCSNCHNSVHHRTYRRKK